VARPRIGKAILTAFGLVVLGVLAWVARHHPSPTQARTGRLTRQNPLALLSAA
jgi:hypothetical protein